MTRRSWFIASVGLMLVACGRNGKSSVSVSKDAICECKDVACLDRVEKDYADAIKSIRENSQGKDAPQEAVESQILIDGCEKRVRAQDLSSAMKSVKDSMCACRDAACAAKVTVDSDATMTAFLEVSKNSKDLPQELVETSMLIDACRTKASDSGDLPKMKSMRDAMCACRDVTCVDKVQKDYSDFMKAMEEKYKGDKKPDENMMRIGEDMAKCMTSAMSEQADNSQSPAASDLGMSTGVPECDDYLVAFNKYMSCDKIPRQAVEASKKGIAQMKEGWAMLRDPNVPAEAKRAAGDACREAVSALKQSAAAMGCPM